MDKIEGTILISDTARGLQTPLMLLLQKHFGNVATESGTATIEEMARKGNIDVVILDAGSNSSNEREKYLELVKRIAGCGQNVQVVALTNFGQSQFALELAEAGAFDFVPKPWNNEKLLVTLRNACRTRQLLNAAVEKAAQDNLSGRKESDSCGGGSEKPVTLEQMEKKMMKGAIKRNRGNISLAAQELGITRQTLYNKGKKYKLFE
jgi:DNA-binding NtrC family response regulator